MFNAECCEPCASELICLVEVNPSRALDTVEGVSPYRFPLSLPTFPRSPEQDSIMVCVCVCLCAVLESPEFVFWRDNADFRRKPQIFEGNRRKLQEPAEIRSLAFVPLGSSS